MYKEFLEEIKKAESEDEISEVEAIDIIKDFIIKKSSNFNVSEEDLKKGAMQAFRTGVGLLGLIHGAHLMTHPEANTNPASAVSEQKEQTVERKAAPEGSYKNKSIKNFLKGISMNESSGGINTDHEQMKSGIHAGDSAYGKYGLMPNTVREMANRMGKKHPLNVYAHLESEDIKSNLKKYPHHEEKIASFMANHLHDKFGGDESKMSYSWNQGHNLTNDHFSSSHKNYKDHPYVQKYIKNKQEIEKNPNIASKK